MLQLSGTPLDAELPACVTQATQLQLLVCSRCGLTGALPLNLGNLSSLEVLDLSFNALAGAVPPSVSRLLKLKTLDVSYNRMASSAHALLQPLALLPALSSLSLSTNFISGKPMTSDP